MSKLNQLEINMWTSFKTPLKIWHNSKKELKSCKTNYKYWKMSPWRRTKQFKSMTIFYKYKSIKEIKPRRSWINMISSRDKRKRMLIKILTKFKNSIWLFFLFKKTCRVSGSNIKKPVRIETIQVFNSLTEMTNSVFYMRNQTFKKIFWESLK